MSYSQTTANLGLPQFQTSDIPTWDDVNAAFALVDVLVGAIAPKYDETDTYNEGDIVQHAGGLFKANQDISVAEQWTPAHWTAIVVADNLENTDLSNFVKYDANAGTGLTAGQYAKLVVNS